MSRQLPLLFVHGWGYGPNIWDGIRAALPEVQSVCIERGYLGAPPFQPTVPAGSIAVTHSAGLMDVLADPPPGCAAIISINGFTRFTAGPDFPDGVPCRLLDRMLARLDVEPDDTLVAFRRRCGDDVSRPTGICPERLREGLVTLRDGDVRLRMVDLGLPIVALAGTADPVVPPALTRACFAKVQLHWHDASGHLLPLTAPDWCAAQLRALLQTLPSR